MKSKDYYTSGSQGICETYVHHATIGHSYYQNGRAFIFSDVVLGVVHEEFAVAPATHHFKSTVRQVASLTVSRQSLAFESEMNDGLSNGIAICQNDCHIPLLFTMLLTFSPLLATTSCGWCSNWKPVS